MPSHSFRLTFTLGALCSAASALAAGEPAAGLTIHPPEFVLHGKASRQRVIVSGVRNGQTVDLTPQVAFSSASPAVAQVDESGMVTPISDGTAAILAKLDGQEARAVVKVIDGAIHLPATFEQDIQPILARAGCNSGPCHGKSRGQNGFQLSLLGFDGDFDFAALTQEGRGRRILPSSPEYSLLLRKGSGQMPHGGGRRLTPGDGHYETLLRWIEVGTPRTPQDQPRLVKITVDPPERVLAGGAGQQLLVTAHFSDGGRRDVTRLALFQSHDSVIATVNGDGLVKAGSLPGEAAIMARYLDEFAVCNILIPMPGQVPAETYARLPRYNFIDGLVWDKLQQLGLTPSAACDDATLLRRAYLDVIGRLPRPQEARDFLADPSADKRERLIDRLLDRPEYADYWANKWADLLRPNPYRVGAKAVFNLDAFLRESFRRNKPYNQFVREILTASGSTFQNGAVVVFRDRREPDELTTMVSQLFLGVRLECAKCHHHPFEIWGQDDFYSFAAFFARIGRKGTGLSPPISGGEEVFFAATKGAVKHPGTGQEMSPRPLFPLATPQPMDGGRDPREVLADWVVSADNPYFARVAVNRVWADIMGRGLVEPVDDLRATNPPSNEVLLEALAKSFREQSYDLKKLIRTIMTSYVYGLSSLPGERNAADLRNYSRHYRQRLRAEVLLDAASDITGVAETFTAAPPGTRAMELWTVRTQSIFLDSFGRPDPNQDPPCERTSDTSVVQALHLMNSPRLHAKVISDAGRAAQLASSQKTPREIVDELYLLVYCRYPSDEERQVGERLFPLTPFPSPPGGEGEGVRGRRQALEDLLWALLNTPEFVFKN